MNWLEDYDAAYSHGQEGVEIRFQGFRIKTENEFDLSCLWPKNKRISNYRPIKVIARHCNKKIKRNKRKQHRAAVKRNRK